MVEQQRTIVASLEMALGFAQNLAGALPVLTQLLASATLTDAQEAIHLLVCFHQFDVEGASAALQLMLPLIFAQDPGVACSQGKAAQDAITDSCRSFSLHACVI